jgi:uncharacterized membrane protein YfhO
MVLAFVVQSIHPVGNRMILTVDLYHQYAPFVAELRSKILSGDSLFYSWNIGLGTNFWATYANYAASPLNFLLLVFPEKFLPDGIALVVCIRAGLTGLFSALLLRDIDQKREDLFLTMFATAYALNGWVLSYFWNIMWHDALMLLPLVILGLRLLMRDKKPVLFCLSLFIVIWSNFYSAFFICIFLVLYAPVCYLTVFDKLTWRRAWSSIWRFALYAALAGAMAAALIYPTWLTLKQSSATGDTFPTDWAMKQEMFDFFARFFVVSNPNIREGMANVYTGVLLALFIPLFFLCRKIRLREKISYGLLLAVMYFSFSNRIMDFIWHGFHFPNQIPYRQAFLMSFLVIIVGYRVLRNLKSLTVSDVTVSVAAIIGYLILYGKFSENGESDIALYLTILFVVVYAVILRSILLGKGSVRAQRYAMCSVMAIELVVASQATIALVGMHEGYTGWDFYAKKINETATFVDSAAKDDDDAFFRTEMYPAFICNQTALYHVKGMSIFSSTADESTVLFMKSLGFHNNGINSFRNNGLTPVTASLFNIEYFIDVNGDAPVPQGFTSVPNDSLTIYRNENALSLGYMVPSDIVAFKPQNRNNPFDTTNVFLQAIGADSVYERGGIISTGSENIMTISELPDSGNTYRISEADKKTVLTLEPDAKEPGAHMYIYLQASKAPSVTVTYTYPDREEPVSKKQETRIQQIIDIGYYDPEVKTSVELKWDKPKDEQITIHAYSINEEAYQSMLSVLSESPFKVDAVTSTSMEGNINAKEAGVLLLTIPFDNGWSATLDGQPVELLQIGDALTGISLSAGKHQVSMKYEPNGFSMGWKISVLGLLVFLTLSLAPVWITYRKNRKTACTTDPALQDSAVNMPDPLKLSGTAPDKTSLSESESIQTEGDTIDRQAGDDIRTCEPTKLQQGEPDSTESNADLNETQPETEPDAKQPGAEDLS